MATKLKTKRTNLGLTQTELAVMTKLSREHLSFLENGKGNPTTRTLAKIAKALDCDIKDLL